MKSDKKTSAFGVFYLYALGRYGVSVKSRKFKLILKCEIAYRLHKVCDK